jgi:hypothetical protein
MNQTFYHPDSVSGMFADRADDWKSAEPYASAQIKFERDSVAYVETDMDGMVCLYVHSRGNFTALYLTAAQAGELETALYRAREHVGGGA